METETIQGRLIGAGELQQVRQLLAGHPELSRWQISRRLALLWDWRNGKGQLKDMAARSLLLKLERRGWIVLPARRRVTPSRMREKRMPALEVPVPSTPINGALAPLLPLIITEVSMPSGRARRPLFEVLLQQHHYLGYRSTVGENLQYLAQSRQGTPLACVLFGAPAWQCADRDRYIGWDGARRAQNLPLIANNTRLMILPWVGVKGLASHLLSQLARRLSTDWQGKYGHPIYLLETFVQRDRFLGTCYRAANWVRVGQTKGRTRQDRAEGGRYQVSIKDVYLYPLQTNFQQWLQGHRCPSKPL